jgi:hypothetical protein
MATATDQEFLSACQSGLSALATQYLQGFAQQGTAAATAFAQASLGDLRRWTTEVATGSMTKDDMLSLLAGAQALAGIEALQQQGLAIVAVNQFRDQCISFIVDKAFGLLA